VPDFYEGTEFWDLSLVDPDNRRPVDFVGRAGMLESIETHDWESLAQQWPDGRIKFALTRHLLKLRTELADVFTYGDYQPLQASGPHSGHVIAFARRHGRDAAIVVVGKLFASLSQGGRAWPRPESFEGSLDLGGYSVASLADDVDATKVPLSLLFQHLPVAVLRARFESAAKRKRSRPRKSAQNAAAARDRGPGGLADVVPTRRFGSLPRTG
jgi:(1->4)-alpha-D-glucan 1-alpha-D-glucosylmutase